MKKGFTLIELLAVIVILAIIAVIAVPIVLNIIEDAKESSILRSAEFYMDGVETSIASAILKNVQIEDGTYSIMQDGNLCIGAFLNNTCTGDILKVEVSGNKPNGGYIEIQNGTIKDIGVSLLDKVVIKNEKEELVFGDKLEIKYTPGVYDKNDNLIASWDELETKYGFKTLIKTDWDWNYGSQTAGKIVDENFPEDSTLVIGADIDYISLGAFSYCSNLREVIIPGNVKSIGEMAFVDCSNLTSLTLEEGITSIDNSAFQGCTSLTSVTIPDSVTSIGSYAFSNCTSLESITLPKKLTAIEGSLFSACENLKEITIPDSVESIGENAFDSSGLESITLPESLTSIGGGAFYGCENLKRITIPSKVTSIESNAFDSSGLESIIIPSSVTSIEWGAFNGCESLTTIYYKGTEAEWNAIAKHESWDENTPSNKEIHYNYAG